MRTPAPCLAALMVIAIAAIARPATAAEIALYEFTSASNVSTDADANSSAANFAKNPATADWGFSTGGNVFARSNATTASEIDAIAAGDYFSFMVTPNAGYEFDLTELTFDTIHNATFGSGTADTGATMEFFVRSSRDGFAANIGSTFSQAWNTTTSRSVDLTGAAFQNIHTATEFRLYIYDSGVDTQINGARIDNVALASPAIAAGGFQEGVVPTPAYTHDAVMIRSNSPTTNQNGAGSIIIGSASTGNELIRGLFEFDISSIGSGAVIDKVSLQLTKLSASVGINNVGAEGALTTFNVYAYGFDIDEAFSTWNDPDGDQAAGTGDTTAGGTFGSLLTSAATDVEVVGEKVVFGDSPAFRAAVEAALAGDGILRLIIANADETNLGTHDFARFFDETATTTSNRPLLTISIGVPTPAALPVGLVLLGLMSMRRRS